MILECQLYHNSLSSVNLSLDGVQFPPLSAILPRIAQAVPNIKCLYYAGNS